MTGETPVWDPYFIDTLEGSFSAVSTPQIARVGAFFSIKYFFRDLQDVNSFAPLHTQKFNKISHFFKIFHQNLHIFQLFWLKFVVFLTDFDENFTGFHEIF